MQPTVPQLLRDVRLAKEARRFPEALVAIEAALAIDPNSGGLLIEKSTILRALGRANDARQTAHRATVLSPTMAEAHAELGMAFIDLGKFANAESSFQRALQFDSRNATALSGFGSLRIRQNRLPEAEALLMSAVRVQPEDSRLMVLLGDVLAARSNKAGMLEAYRRARDLDGRNGEALDKFLAAKEEVGGVDAARAALEEAVARMPDVALVHARLGEFLAGHGMLPEAAISYRRAADLEPVTADALQFLAATQKIVSQDDPDFRRIVEGYNRSEPGGQQRAVIAIALAKASDALKDYPRAFELYSEGNQILRRGMAFSMAREAAAFPRVAAAFTAEIMARFRGGGQQTSAPIFVVGMPRSGTTLTETVLSRHPGVYPAGELEFMDSSATGVAGEDPVYEADRFVRKLKPALLVQIGATYLAQLNSRARESHRFIDKLPHNFRLLGLIHLVFPKARIVHVRRDPLDNCLSLFKANLGSDNLAFSRDLVEVGRYYNLYRGLMQHWRAVLPGQFLEIDYEALVSDPETTTRTLFDYCGLEWSPDVLDIQKSTHEVQTASFAQVREPINTRSISSADRYGDLLDPLRAALAEYKG